MIATDRHGNTVRVHVSNPAALGDGVGHVYPRLVGYWCERHGRECSPYPPVRLGDVLARAANDPSLPDGAFVALSRTFRGVDPLDGEDG